MDYGFLKSGTDVRGVATDLGGEAIQITDAAVREITAAFLYWLSQRENGKTDFTVAVGHDSRITADRIANCVKESLIKGGAKVLDCGLCSTPAMFMTTVDLAADAAIQITASHHPFDRNGLKFFLPTGGLESDELSEILAFAAESKCLVAQKTGIAEPIHYLSTYTARLRKMICDACQKSESERPLAGFHIIVDAGNGVGGFYATEVLAPLGADISGSQFLEPDGTFPNHIPNPENETAMASVCAAVRESGADFGIIFDTDVDRAGCVGRDGKEINRNRLIALAAHIALQGNAGGTVVTDSVTSDGLKEYIENTLGGVHYRYRRGYKNVIDKARELCANGINCPLAIETSGHAALRENYFLDDGAYLVTKIVIELARGCVIEDLLQPLKMPVEAEEYRLNITTPDFRQYGKRVIDELTVFSQNQAGFNVAPDNREGIRVSTPNGWFLLRLSVHDPVMALNLESTVTGGIQKDIEILLPFLKRFDALDFSAFEL